MLKAFFTTIISFVGLASFAQTYEPDFNAYYENEINSLKENYSKEDVKLDLVLVYGDWLKDIKKEKSSISERQADPVYAQRLEDLGALEEKVIREMSGKPAPKPEPIVEEKPLENTSDTLVAESKKPEVKEEPQPETPPAPKKNIEEESLPKVKEKVEEKVVEEQKPEIEPYPDFNESKKETSPSTKSLSELFASEIDGVFFRVQVFAANTQFPGSNIAKRLNLTEEIIEEEDNGMYKYLVGKFSLYNSARVKADELRTNAGVQAFVVGYQNENRTPLNVIFGTK